MPELMKTATQMAFKIQEMEEKLIFLAEEVKLLKEKNAKPVENKLKKKK
tara:strand:- start:565 stop:711 length:147 start_codon:yes stop_codon:yes gene_type:complete